MTCDDGWINSSSNTDSSFSTSTTKALAKAAATLLSETMSTFALVLYRYFPFGGLQEDCLLTAQQIRRKGHQVSMICRLWKGERPKDINVIELGERGWTNSQKNENFFSDLEKSLNRQKFDQVVAFNRIPICDVYVSADPCYLERVSQKPFWYFWTARHRHYRKVEVEMLKSRSKPLICCLTNKEVENYQRHYDLDDGRFVVVPPVIAKPRLEGRAAKIARNSLREKLNIGNSELVALFVGSNFELKGLGRILDALEANAGNWSFRVVVVGNGKAKTFEDRIIRKRLPVRFYPATPDIENYFAMADFLLHPAYSESAGKVLLEALSYGLPVVTTETCGYAPQITESGGGVVIEEPYKNSALESAIEEMVDDESRETFASRALAYMANSQNYSGIETIADTVIERAQRAS